MHTDCLFARCREVLLCDQTERKLALTAATHRQFVRGMLQVSAGAEPPHAIRQPGRPPRPMLVPPRELRSRSLGSPVGHAALIHAIAHIELNAVNLALDAAYRFRDLPHDFYADWLAVAADEAVHFELLRTHLQTLGHEYGDFPAHDGLWEMAVKTAHDPLARMALVPRVLEARGLDASPGIIRRLRARGDDAGADIVEIILRDEVGHVAIGSRWFEHLCIAHGLAPGPTFERLLTEYDAPRPVLPLNTEARRRGGFDPHELAHLERLARRNGVRS